MVKPREKAISQRRPKVSVPIVTLGVNPELDN